MQESVGTAEIQNPTSAPIISNSAPVRLGNHYLINGGRSTVSTIPRPIKCNHVDISESSEPLNAIIATGSITIEISSAANHLDPSDN